MHAGIPLCIHSTTMPPWTALSLFIWCGPPQFPSLRQWCRSQRMPTIPWSYLSFSFSSGPILCSQWPLWCWWDVSRTHPFHPNMARSSTTLWHRIFRDWSRAPRDERHDSRSCFSFFFFYISRRPLSMRSQSSVPYSWNWTRWRYRVMGRKTKV